MGDYKDLKKDYRNLYSTEVFSHIYNNVYESEAEII